jgi:hypothetical protein
VRVNGAFGEETLRAAVFLLVRVVEATSACVIFAGAAKATP